MTGYCRPYLLMIAAIFILASPLFAQEFPKKSMEHFIKYLLYLREDDPDKALAELILSYQTNPQAQDLLSEIVEMALEMRQLELARIYANIARQIRPKDAETLYLQAQVLQASGQSKEALALLLEAKALAPQNPAVIMALASVYAHLDDRRKALEHLDAYLNLEPMNVELLKIKAHYEYEENNPRALQTLRQAFEEDHRDPQILDALIAAYQRFSTPDQLEKFFDDAIKEMPNQPEIAIKRCSIRESEEQTYECLAEFLVQDPENSAALGYWLDLLEKSEQWETALETLNEHPQATAQEPIFALKESFYLLHQERLQEAVAALEAAQKRFPKNDDIPYFLALGYEDLHDHNRAKETLGLLYQRRPDWREVAYAYALACGETEDYASMEQILQELLKRYPDDPMILNALGFTWTEKGKNLEQARQFIERALASDPTNASYQDSLAWTLFKLGEGSEALKILKKTAQQTYDAEILLHLSELEQENGQSEAAWSSYLSARFEIARTRKASARLLASLSRLEHRLDRKAQPKPEAVLEERLADPNRGLSGLFQCEWKLRGQNPFRMRFSFKGPTEESRLRVLYWPPGIMVPVTRDQVIQTISESRTILEEFEAALEGFFARHSWSKLPHAPPNRPVTPRLQWKIKEDFSVRANGQALKMEFSDLYRDANLESASGAGGLVPRTIELTSPFLNGTCQALDYAKE